MNISSLTRKLDEIGVPSYLYNLDGIGRKDERFCMEFVNNEWQVYFSERGIKTINERFASEDEACQFIYKQFSKQRKIRGVQQNRNKILRNPLKKAV